MPRYEVWCPNCDVSFPVGSKRCLHCGGRIVNERPARALVKGAARFGRGEAPGSELPVFTTEQGSAVEVAAPHAYEDEEEEESPRRRGLRAGMSIIWMLLLAAGYIWQNCAGGPA